MLWRSVLGTGSGNSKSRLGTVLARSINGLPAIADTPAQGKVLVSGNAKRRGFPRRFRLMMWLDQRSSCSTLCCDWFASASADTAIDWRVASAWLFAASSLVSASVRFDEPVCSTLIRFFEKS